MDEAKTWNETQAGAVVRDGETFAFTVLELGPGVCLHSLVSKKGESHPVFEQTVQTPAFCFPFGDLSRWSYPWSVCGAGAGAGRENRGIKGSW